MSLDSWILSLKEKRKQKQEMKLKHKFQFLIDLIAENEKNANEKIQALCNVNQKNNLDIIQKLRCVNERIQTLGDDIKKLQSDADESVILVQDKIENINKCFAENCNIINESIRSLYTSIELVGKNEIERKKQLESILQMHNEQIRFQIEEVKSFLQISVVNDEKNAEEKMQVLYDAIQKNNLSIIQELQSVGNYVQALDDTTQNLQSNVGEGVSLVQENIEDIKNRLEENSNEIKENMHSELAEIELIDKYEAERYKQLEDVLLTKSELITSGLETVKSLVQILAVNELVDEINISSRND